MQGSDLPSEVVHHPHGVEVGKGPLPPSKTTRQKLDDSLQIFTMETSFRTMVTAVVTTMVTACQNLRNLQTLQICRDRARYGFGSGEKDVDISR